MKTHHEWKRLGAFCLVLILLLSALAMTACAGEDGPGTAPTPTDNPSGTPEATPTKEPKEVIPLDIPAKTYGGAEVHAIEWTVTGCEGAGNGWVPWEDIAVEEYDGDAISSAVYLRNGEVEKLLDVEITCEYAGVDGAIIKSRVQQDASSGDNAYQLMTHRTNAVISFLQDGLLYNMNEFADTILHTDMPWWVQDAVKSFSLGDKLYICSSEMLLRDKGATACLFFNQNLAKDYVSLPNFFALVDSGEWTYEQMIDACVSVSSSLDGDDLINSGNDMWGVSGGDDPVYFLYNSFGYKFARVDDEGFIEYEYGDEETLTVMKEIFDTFMYQDWNTSYYAVTQGGTIEGDVFKNGNCLFRCDVVKTAVLGMRDMEEDFGILPYPKYDDLQDEYSSLVWMHHDCVFGIPSQTADPEMSAMVIEALSWYSYYNVYETFYDTVLLDRSTRDADSKRMLELIFNTRSYDPGQFWDDDAGLHGADGILRNSAKGTSDMVSMWEKWSARTMSYIDKANEWIAGLDD